MDENNDSLPPVSDILSVKPSSKDMLESDDSDDSLPPLSSIFSAEPRPSGISKGDIVWARPTYQKLYWPALVRNLYKKEKKVSVWFADDPGKTFKFPIKSVYLFDDAEMNRRIENDAIEAGCLVELERVVSHVEDYLERREKGQEVDPMKFFDQTYPFLQIEKHLKENPGDDISDLKVDPIYFSPHGKGRKVSASKNINVQKTSSSSSKSNLESADSDRDSESNAEDSQKDSEQNDEDVPKDYLALISRAISPSKSNNKNTAKIVKFIKSGKSDDYLKKILKKLVPSKHRDAYERGLKNKKNLPVLSNAGPINDNNKIRELFDYLLSLYNTVKNAQMGKRNSARTILKKDKFFNRQSLKCDDPNFVCSVWLPESIIYAMSHVYNISLENAWQLFEKKPDFDAGVIESIISRSDSEDMNSESEPKRKLRHQNSRNTQACSAAKKICF